jgi:nitrite reductase/ring-hydroxylating ferredoxin subunit/DMSO/TMAO reductase YedYZ heme-binding membrane subunit
MSAGYRAVLWNRQKKRYDLVMITLIAVYLVVFTLVTIGNNPFVRPESLIIRGTGSLAFIMLNIIIAIGPLCRLNNRFLPLLYNRRHLGVAMFLIAAIHGTFSIIQFHSLGDVHPLVSLFSSNVHLDIPGLFPFQPLGFVALIILLLMAATSHDFWLKNLSPLIWKSLHMMVYAAYLFLLGHVALGILQYEAFPVRYIMVGAGMIFLVVLHVSAAFKGRKSTTVIKTNGASNMNALSDMDGASNLQYVCSVDDIQSDRAKIVVIGSEEIAVFKYGNAISAVHNLCKHQNGPLGEGKVVDGCITCPWHGYQYIPNNGCSPPPFNEKISTYHVEVDGRKVYVDPNPLAEGTYVEPARFE